jgi:hypothetical protein
MATKNTTLNNRFLIVYNTCEITHNNLFWYLKCLQNLLNQDYSNFHITVSGCKITEATKLGLRKKFGNRLSYNFIDDTFPVNVTFNHTVKVITKEMGDFDGYIYVDSGMNPENQTNILSEINFRSCTNQYGMISVQPSTDSGVDGWFGMQTNQPFTGQDFIVPVGKAICLHLQYFNHKLLEYYGRIIPDIFKTFCTESTFSFLNAAIGLKWIIIKDLIVTHEKATDGPCGLVNHKYYGEKETWNNLLGGLDIKNLIMTKEGKELGMGYEEMQKVFLHDPNCYDENGFSKNPELKNFIKKNLFVPKNMVDYDKINHTLIM